MRKQDLKPSLVEQLAAHLSVRSINGRRGRARLVFFLSIILLTVGSYRSMIALRSHINDPYAASTSLFQGITYLKEVRFDPRPNVFHTVTIDLEAPGLHFLVTPPIERNSPLPLRAQTTSHFLSTSGAQVAINGDFFFPYHPRNLEPTSPEGFASSCGIPYGTYPKRWTRPALCISKYNSAEIRLVKSNEPTPYNAIGGGELLIERGEVETTVMRHNNLDPRTAVGIDRIGRHLFLVAVDGRQLGRSEGISLSELAHFLLDKGAYSAINLDGGGSTTLVVQGTDGRSTLCNVPVNFPILGTERPVANHLAVFARPL